MYKLAVCDDDVSFRVSLERFLSGFFSERSMACSIVSFADTKSFDESISNGVKYDLVFLDIMFQDDNGINYAKRLRLNRCGFDIIFITTSKEYAVESFDVNPLYYIVKPIESKKITAALERFIEKNTPRYVCLNSSGETIKISISDILYFEIYGHRVIIHKNDGTQSDMRGTLKGIEAQLPSAAFIRPHRSYIVNISSITEISRCRIKISNGELVPVSKALYNKIQNEFVDYLEKNVGGGNLLT